MKLKELLEKRAAQLAIIQRLRQVLTDESRDLNDGEQKEWDDANAEYDSLNARIDKLQRAEKLENEARNNPALHDADGRDADNQMDETRASVLAVNAFCRRHAGKDLTDEQRRAVQQINFRNAGNTLDVPIMRRAPQNLAEVRAQSAIEGAGGGFTVPQGFVTDIETGLLTFANMRPACDVIRTPNGNPIPWPTCDDTSNEGSWVGESEDNSNGTDVSFKSVTFGAHKASSKVILIPFELLEDSAFDILTYISGLAGERIGRAAQRAYTTGNGVKKPMGFVNSAAVGKTTAGATAVTYVEMLDLEHSVDPAYRPNASYMMHDNILGAIRKLQDGAGTFIWQPGVSGAPDKINNYPLIINQCMASSLATTNKTMAFGNFKKYKIRDVNAIRMKVLTERYAEYDQLGVLVMLRTDGHLLDAGTNPIKVLQQA